MYRISVFLIASLFLLMSASCGNTPGTKKETASTVGDSASSKELEALNARLRSNPHDPALYQERAKYHVSKKEYDQALADMKRVLEIDSTKGAYYLTIADIYFTMNKTGDSKKALEKCHSLDPQNTDCLMKLAELYFYVRKYEESLGYLDEVLKADQFNAKAYFMKGMNFKEAGDTLKAISSMQTAVEQDNNYYNAYIQLGILCGAKHNILAEGYYKNALRIQPASPEALYDLARFYQDIENYKDATTMYNQLLAIDPGLYDVQFNLGVIEIKLNAYDEAIKYFNTAIGIKPKDPRAYYGRGLCYQREGKVQNAAADYRYSITLDPHFELAKEGLKEMHIY
jgi:tetratricopeptide (TPR) repeat protein